MLLWTANDPWTASALNLSAKHCNYCRLSSRIRAPLPLPSCPLSSGPSPLVTECAPVNSVFIHLDAISRQGTAVSGMLASMIRYKCTYVGPDLTWFGGQASPPSDSSCVEFVWLLVWLPTFNSGLDLGGFPLQGFIGLRCRIANCGCCVVEWGRVDRSQYQPANHRVWPHLLRTNQSVPSSHR